MIGIAARCPCRIAPMPKGKRSKEAEEFRDRASKSRAILKFEFGAVQDIHTSTVIPKTSRGCFTFP
jgi:hypothetical protein